MQRAMAYKRVIYLVVVRKKNERESERVKHALWDTYPRRCPATARGSYSWSQEMKWTAAITRPFAGKYNTHRAASLNIDQEQ